MQGSCASLFLAGSILHGGSDLNRSSQSLEKNIWKFQQLCTASPASDRFIYHSFLSRNSINRLKYAGAKSENRAYSSIYISPGNWVFKQNTFGFFRKKNSDFLTGLYDINVKISFIAEVIGFFIPCILFQVSCNFSKIHT